MALRYCFSPRTIVMELLKLLSAMSQILFWLGFKQDIDLDIYTMDEL